jgi:hypothetical protein
LPFALVIQVVDFAVVLVSAQLAWFAYNESILKEAIYYEKFSVPVVSSPPALRPTRRG